MVNLEFLNPEYLYLFLLLPVFIFWETGFLQRKVPFFQKNIKRVNIQISTILPFNNQRSLKQKLIFIPDVIKYFGLSFLIIAIARPVSSVSYENSLTEAIDIVFALDVSASMLAQDFSPNRLESAKNEAIRFLSERPSNRFAVVVFGGDAFTQCPLTVDQDVLRNTIKEVRSGFLEDGTAIGVGLATAINRLKKSVSKSKVIILLTDGVNNAGSIDPKTVSKIAQKLKIKIYSIGIGSRGTAPYPYQDQFGRTTMRTVPVEIDEALLKEISAETGGKYFRATSNKRLRAIYASIDKLEKTEIEVKEYKNKTDEFFIFAYIAGTLLLLQKIILFTYFRSIT